MNTSELRIGNYFHWIEDKFDDNDIYRIHDTKSLKTIVDNIGFFRPVYITEEWLIRFGFTKRFMFRKGDIEIKHESDDGTHWFMFHFKGVDLRAVFYVHELQNLVYWLTGEELELKSNTENTEKISNNNNTSNYGHE